MLIVMSFNALLIGTILSGGFVGHFLFHRGLDLGGLEDDLKGPACH